MQNGNGVQYSWNFDDGKATDPVIKFVLHHAHLCEPGHLLRQRHREPRRQHESDRDGRADRDCPLTSRKPSASASIAFENRGNGRVWVVNADNESVSVINAATNARVAEITVGSKPRSLAIAPNGRIWPMTKSATISVIDPTSLAVTQTIALPFGSQPYGIAFAPGGAAAYVTLGATGMLVKLNPSTGAQVGSVSVGPNPRHLSIGSDGSTVYVSRFITRPLAGEATAAVQTTGGGEVVVVNGTSMAVLSTVLLHVSPKDDFEKHRVVACPTTSMRLSFRR